MFNSFLSDLQLNRSSILESSVIYVDQESETLKFVTSVMRSAGTDKEIFAFSVASEGNVEILSSES
ncbi:MAG: hypothetical protein COW00_06265 [Bdellovibrio sp. CG12_big_fil_rev_8_21_14_0_65_39_13]|nr:MAG: hypothetical protein COW78_18800 [Bdellovibrio sp. CG22_combo_CG10-13_8_21_14_all_39_27]PIQ60827.1 MAG: hypothetical protein COW00_06265 [Bdellovibrio sp. CG12_big_fil_rev_8_21_14_0_65_39_13]PIR36451.1 MAG: hypothetical protein COV37_03605 [Bdellovibrio sp. CG11_big_fil_rev_8_21_14_0_20_39_38]PJB54126.1 MAG: hypothetical protein CO099_03290 [Bdellovibrio sp. CG_4_9_14_3_um_filter_39_7]